MADIELSIAVAAVVGRIDMLPKAQAVRDGVVSGRRGQGGGGQGTKLFLQFASMCTFLCCQGGCNV